MAYDSKSERRLDDKFEASRRDPFDPNVWCPVDTDALIAERERTHGNFDLTAAVAQKLKAVFRDTRNWPSLSDRQREGCDLLACKLARFFSGDPEVDDHLVDAISYIELVRGKR